MRNKAQSLQVLAQQLVVEVLKPFLLLLCAVTNMPTKGVTDGLHLSYFLVREPHPLGKMVVAFNVHGNEGMFKGGHKGFCLLRIRGCQTKDVAEVVGDEAFEDTVHGVNDKLAGWVPVR